MLALVYVPIQADKALKIKKDKVGKDPYDNKLYMIEIGNMDFKT